MKTTARYLGILIATVITFALTGCATPKQTVVTEAPPPPQQDSPSTPPNSNYTWAEGHWIWNGQWVWQAGHWMLRPTSHTIWEPGSWVQAKGGWVWHDGQWHDTGMH